MDAEGRVIRIVIAEPPESDARGAAGTAAALREHEQLFRSREPYVED